MKLQEAAHSRPIIFHPVACSNSQSVMEEEGAISYESRELTECLVLLLPVSS